MKYVLFALALILFAPSAHAEDQWEFMQINCGKDLSYFTLRTIHLFNNLEKTGSPDEKTNHYYDVGEILKKPYECVVKGDPYFTDYPTRTVKVKIKDYQPGVCDETRCKPYARYSIAIEIDGKEIHQFTPLGGHRSESHLIEIDKFSLRDCILPTLHNGSNVEPTCTRINIDKFLKAKPVQAVKP